MKGQASSLHIDLEVNEYTTYAYMRKAQAKFVRKRVSIPMWTQAH